MRVRAEGGASPGCSSLLTGTSSKALSSTLPLGDWQPRLSRSSLSILIIGMELKLCKGVYIGQERPSTRGFIRVPELKNRLFRGVNGSLLKLVSDSEVEVTLEPQKPRQRKRRQEGKDTKQQTRVEVEHRSENEVKDKLTVKDEKDLKAEVINAIIQGQQVRKEVKENDAEEEQEEELSEEEAEQQQTRYTVKKVVVTKNPLLEKDFTARVSIEPRRRALAKCLKNENALDWFHRNNYIDILPRNRRYPKMTPFSFDKAVEAILEEVDYEMKYSETEGVAIRRVLERGILQCRWKEWRKSRNPMVEVVGYIGRSGYLKPELKATLVELDIDFPPLQEPRLSKPNLEGRTPYRARVFTIDPEQSVDLDDALSLLDNGDGTYELGVHIAGVCSILGMVDWKDMTTRTSTLYYPHKADHLLPHDVVKLATLDTNGAKSCLSAVMQVDGQGELAGSSRFQKTVVESACRLSYDVALAIIDGRISKPEDMPERFRVKDYRDFDSLSWQVRKLNELMQNRFKRRLQQGYVVNSKQEIKWKTAEMNGEPLDFTVYVRHEAHRLVQQAMILANGEAAGFMALKNPAQAIKIYHPTPRLDDIQKLNKQLEKISSCRGIFRGKQQKPLRLEKANQFKSLMEQVTKDYKPEIAMVLERLWIKCQEPAKYVVGSNPEQQHFALMMENYTHFTSPMRRMADDFVHLQIEATLEGREVRSVSQQQLANLNRMRKACKELKYKMDNLFFGLLLIQKKRQVRTEAIVVDINGREVTLLIPLLNCSKRVKLTEYHGVDYCDKRQKSRPKAKTNRKASKKTQDQAIQKQKQNQAPGLVVQYYDQSEAKFFLQIQKYEGIEVEVVVLRDIELSFDLRLREQGRSSWKWLAAVKPRLV